MKDKTDLVRGWLRKAESDIKALEASLSVEAFDAACFHAQQSVEKHLKAYLLHHGAEFPFTHNLAKLLEICAGLDQAFRTLLPLVEPLTPYAVELRYDAEFWPGLAAVEEARAAAKVVRDFVVQRLPNRAGRGPDIGPPTTS
ncbi:MAG: HEPN domain-containing protein [Thermodesulfobacteriota bacterium]